jgi:hypothetical protein
MRRAHVKVNDFQSIHRFRLRGKWPPDHASRFRKPPFSSRTVGFPESGWRL